MTQKAPLHVIWWLVSRASGIVALVLISLSVLMGLAMAARAIRRPAIKRAVARLHEHVALVAILAIAIHGVALLGDHWLKPGMARDHDPVRALVPPGVHRTRNHRGLPHGAARAELLPAPADRRATLAHPASRARS